MICYSDHHPHPLSKMAYTNHGMSQSTLSVDINDTSNEPRANYHGSNDFICKLYLLTHLVSSLLLWSIYFYTYIAESAH